MRPVEDRIELADFILVANLLEQSENLLSGLWLLKIVLMYVKLGVRGRE